jgi:hypothetical protein
MDTEVTATIETITPEAARQYLAMMGHNRAVKRQNLAHITADMAADRWQLNGEAIKFNGSKLVDGQHRLLACIAADRSFTTLVVRGLEPEAIKVIDLGARRAVADVLHMFGDKQLTSTTTLAACARLIMSLQRRPDMPKKVVGLLTLSEIVAEVEANPERYQNASLYGRRFNKWSNPSAAAALMILASQAGYSIEQLDEYHDKVQSGADLTKNDPCLTYRNWISSRPLRAHMDGFTYLSAHVKCFGASANGRTLQKLYVWDGKSPFPTLERPA